MCCLIAASCTEGLSADADYFDGLDGTVVAEILEHPAARQKIEEEPSATRASMAQGIAVNFMVCRDALRAYQGWVSTGVAPSLGPLPKPIHPREPSFSANENQYARLAASLDSGELDQLRLSLTGEGSCGQWIPASPGDAAGPTIKDVVEGG